MEHAWGNRKAYRVFISKREGYKSLGTCRLRLTDNINPLVLKDDYSKPNDSYLFRLITCKVMGGTFKSQSFAEYQMVNGS